MADYGEIAEAAAEIALEAALVIAINNVQNDYFDLATKYYNDYSAQRQFYFDNFQLQGEAPFATEQFGISFYIPDYVGLFNTGYFPPGTWYLFGPQITLRKNVFGNTSAGTWKRFADRYAATQDTSSYIMDLASTFDDWSSYQNRYEEHRRDVFNERKWANEVGALSFGVKEAYIVERGLATSFADFDKAQGELVSEESTVANGLATFAGYRKMQKALELDLGTDPNYQEHSFLRNIIPNG